MKVLYLLDSLNRGGTENLALDVCRNARCNALDLIFVTTGGGTLEPDFRESGVEFIRLRRKLPLDPQIIFNLRRIIRSRGIDVVHAHQSVEALHAYFATIGTKCRLVFSHHGYIADRKNLFSLKFLIPRVAQNLVCSRAMLNWYREFEDVKFPQNTLVVHNGVDAKRLVWKGESFREEVGISSKTLLFGMIANFYRDPRKDQITVCRALPKIFAAIPDARFIFVGKIENGGEDIFQECRKICIDGGILQNVIFAGARSDIPKILESLDIFVLSSLREGLPISVLEAMLAAKPCLLSDIEPLLEVSGNGNFAQIFATGNVESLVDKLIGMAKDSESRHKQALCAKTFAAENYSIEAHIEKLLQVYNSLER